MKITYDPKIRRLLLAGLFAGATCISVVAAAERLSPVTVSPGGAPEEGTSASACPTFSWGLLLAEKVEVAVHRVFRDGTPDTSYAVGEWIMPGSVTGWTPSGADCFEPGQRYAWSVRGLDLVDGELVATEWAKARHFDVRLSPSAEEIEAALDVLRRAEADQGRVVGAVPAAVESNGAERGRPSTPAEQGGPFSVLLTPPAEYGLVSEVSGVDAAAIYAKNSDGSAGYFEGEVEIAGGLSAQGQASFSGGLIQAEVTAGGPAVLAIGTNGGLGRLGHSHTGVSGSTSNPNGYGVIGENTAGGKAGKFTADVDVDGDLNLSGSLQCTDCVESDDLKMLAVTTPKIAFQAVTTDRIAPAAVTAARLASNAVHSANIIDRAISTSKLAPGAVTGPKVADDAISTANIQDGAVSPSKLSIGLYRSRTDIYFRQESDLIDPTSDGEATASCDSVDDLPLAGGCLAQTSEIHLFKNHPVAWGPTSTPFAAAWTCEGRNRCDSLGCRRQLTARILCIRRTP